MSINSVRSEEGLDAAFGCIHSKTAAGAQARTPFKQEGRPPQGV